MLGCALMKKQLFVIVPKTLGHICEYTAVHVNILYNVVACTWLAFCSALRPRQREFERLQHVASNVWTFAMKSTSKVDYTIRAIDTIY